MILGDRGIDFFLAKFAKKEREITWGLNGKRVTFTGKMTEKQEQIENPKVFLLCCARFPKISV